MVAAAIGKVVVSIVVVEHTAIATMEDMTFVATVVVIVGSIAIINIAIAIHTVVCLYLLQLRI
jgi:hypothetical protein